MSRRVRWSHRIPPSNRSNLRAATRRLVPEEELEGMNTEELANNASARLMRSDVEYSTAINQANESDHTLEQLEAKLRHVHRTIRSLTHNVGVLSNNGSNNGMRNAVREELKHAQKEMASLHDRILQMKRQAARNHHRADRAKQNTRAESVRSRANHTIRRYQKRPQNTRERGERVTLGGTRKRTRSPHRVTWSHRIPSESSRPLRSRHPAPFSEEQIAAIASASPLAAYQARQRSMQRPTEQSIALNQAKESENRMYELEALQRRAHREGNHTLSRHLQGNALHASRRAARNMHRAMRTMRDPNVIDLMSAAEQTSMRYDAIPLNTRERGARVTL